MCVDASGPTTAAEGADFVFDSVKIRTTPDGQMVAIDILKALGYKNPSKAWVDIQQQHPDDFVTQKVTYSFGRRGRPPEVQGERSVNKLAMVAGKGSSQYEVLLHPPAHEKAVPVKGGGGAVRVR